MSVALSEMTGVGVNNGQAGQLSIACALGQQQHQQPQKSPEHLVNRKVLLERMGMTVDGTSDTQGSHSARPGSAVGSNSSGGRNSSVAR